MESFFASLKKELIYRRKYDTIEEVKTDIFKYIELFSLLSRAAAKAEWLFSR